MPTPAKILVVDDQQLVRQTVCALLKRAASSATLHWQLYEAADGRAAVDRAREIKPDVVVMNIELP
jgi:CheY-like chemotaxis protein